MQALKAPGPDRYGVCFYQNNWSVVGEEVRKAVLNFLNFEIFDPSINYTYLV
jgi:hypothetical protein